MQDMFYHLTIWTDKTIWYNSGM